MKFLLEYSDYKYQYINKEGNVVLKTKYFSSDFNEGLAGVAIEGEDLEGFMDKSGDIVIEPNYYFVDEFKDGFARVQVKKPKIDLDKKPIINRVVEEEWSYIDMKGTMKIDSKFDYACNFSEGLAQVGFWSEESHMYKMGYINTSGEFTINPQFIKADGFAGDFQNGIALVAVAIEGKDANNNYDFNVDFGFINKDGKFVFGLFDYAQEFSEGLAYVRQNDKNGYINEEGKMVLELDSKYDYFGQFNDGLAYVGWE